MGRGMPCRTSGVRERRVGRGMSCRTRGVRVRGVSNGSVRLSAGLSLVRKRVFK